MTTAVVTPTVETPAVPAAAAIPPLAVEAAPAPVPAPVAAPVVIGEAPAAAADELPAVVAADGAVTYDLTGDAGLDVALAFVGKLGIASDHPAMKATADGDFSLIKAHLATMGDKATGWEQMVALAEASHVRVTAEAAKTQAAINTAVHSAAGGEDNWNAVNVWASANADPAEKEALNAMFAAGPVQARAATLMLCNLYNEAPGTTKLPASATTGAPGAATEASNSGPLTAKQYNAAVNVLNKRVGSAVLQTHPEYIALGKRLSNG